MNETIPCYLCKTEIPANRCLYTTQESKDCMMCGQCLKKEYGEKYYKFVKNLFEPINYEDETGM